MCRDMGLQVECPMCGMSRDPDHFQAREIAAKQVQSLGGNRGFDHTPVEVPLEVREQIVGVISDLYREYVEAVREEVDQGEIEQEIGQAVRDALIEQEIEQAVRDALAEEDEEMGQEEIEQGIDAAIEEAVDKP